MVPRRTCTGHRHRFTSPSSRVAAGFEDDSRQLPVRVHHLPADWSHAANSGVAGKLLTMEAAPFRARTMLPHDERHHLRCR